MATAIISSKGQLTLPKQIRVALGLSPGDRVNFVRMEDGNYAVLPATHSVQTLKGLLRRPKQKPVSIEDMNQAIAKGAAGNDWS